MPATTDLLKRYFVQAEDVGKPGEFVPHTSAGNEVSYFIDGEQYFAILQKEIEELLGGGNNRYFYFADWVLGLVAMPAKLTTGISGSGLPYLSAYTQETESDYLVPLSPVTLGTGVGAVPNLLSELKKMASAGVDVRALLWVKPYILNYSLVAEALPGIWRINVHTAMSAIELQSHVRMQTKVVLTARVHPVGAMHLKMVVCGDDSSMRAYVAGMDLTATRFDTWQHRQTLGYYLDAKDKRDIKIGWHDVGVRVQGPAASEMYNFYRTLWNEELSLEPTKLYVAGKRLYSHELATQKVPERAPSIGSGGEQHVQVLRTAPQMNIGWSSTSALPKGCCERFLAGVKQPPLSFAEHGIFEFSSALRKAIGNATEYIYMEDQGFNSLDIMKWINESLRKVPALKVILLHGPDPADAPSGLISESINKHLIADVDDLADRIVFCEYKNLTVHSKITIIDDNWAAIGTANAARRSLYTDEECSIGVIDGGEAPTFPQRLRAGLWGEHCGKAPGPDRYPMLELASALGIWHSEWGIPPEGFELKKKAVDADIRPYIERVMLPYAGWPPFNQDESDSSDPDSREVV